MAVMFTLPMYHICLICTAIGSLVQGELPHQGAVLVNIKYVWYYVHMLAVKLLLRRVCTKFVMLIRVGYREATAGLDILCRRTKKQFAVRPRGLQKIQNYIHTKISRRGVFTGVGKFLYFLILESYS